MTRGAWIAVIAVELVAVCCCGSILLAYFVGSFDKSSNQAVPTAAALTTPNLFPATLTLAPKETVRPQRTNTSVIPVLPTATSSHNTICAFAPASSLSNMYSVIVPTPTPPALTYPVSYTQSLSVVMYAVTGTTLAAISQSLNLCAIPDPHEPNSRYYADTQWYYAAQWAWKETTRGCEVDHADISIVMTMTLPSLASPSVPREVTDRWSTFMKNTITHESGHVKLAQDGGRKLQSDLGNFPPASDCSAIKLRLKSAYDMDFNAVDQMNVKYDAETKHGATQGAVFP
jgi:predicted secreted Zn-dependent protease